MEISLLDLKKLFESCPSAPSLPSSPTSFTGKYVIVRSAPSGVHVGYVEEYNSPTNTIVLKDSRRIHYWEKAFTLSAIANHGLDTKNKEIRISETLDLIVLGYICELIPCSSEAKEKLMSFPDHRI